MMSSRRLIAMQPIGKTDSSISSDEAKNLRSVENYFLGRDTRKATTMKLLKIFIIPLGCYSLYIYIRINVLHSVCFNCFSLSSTLLQCFKRTRN